MKIVVLIFAAGCLVSACTARGIGEDFMSQQEIDTKDDSTCKSLGASPGTAIYVDCRLKLKNNRSIEAVK